MVKGRLNHLVHEFYYVDDGDEARHSHNEYEGCILIFDDEKEHQRFRILSEKIGIEKMHLQMIYGFLIWNNYQVIIWVAFREEYLNMQILRKMLEEFRKNDNTKN